jgi:hypothetical protein
VSPHSSTPPRASQSNILCSMASYGIFGSRGRPSVSHLFCANGLCSHHPTCRLPCGAPGYALHNARCTKSLRDSFGLTTLVRLERILWCAALGRTRNTVRLPPLTWGMDGRTLLRSEERTDTIPIAHTPCHSAAPMRSLPWLALFVERLSTTNAIRSAQGWVRAHCGALSPEHSR